MGADQKIILLLLDHHDFTCLLALAMFSKTEKEELDVCSKMKLKMNMIGCSVKYSKRQVGRILSL